MKATKLVSGIRDSWRVSAVHLEALSFLQLARRPSLLEDWELGARCVASLCVPTASFKRVSYSNVRQLGIRESISNKHLGS